MAELLKNIYNDTFFEAFLKPIPQLIPSFEKALFLKQIYDGDWENKELKQRMSHITTTLHAHLTNDFKKDVDTLLKLIPLLLENGFKADNFECMFLPDYIEVYGLEDYQTSVQALEEITKFVSCEFAVRPFIIKYEKEMIEQMLKWSKHDHAAVRRLASEGSRPRLPWAMAIPSFKKDPAPVLPILENLKKDPSETVRRSVANNLNDISKDNPETVIAISKKWKGQSVETDKLIKHACRTLLKQGIPEVMSIFGFGTIDKIETKNFQIATPNVSIGKFLEFSFKIKNTTSQPVKLRLEYGLYYQKANGTLSRKVFKISEKIYDGRSETTIIRKQPFKVITTRKFHPGQHQVSLIINGIELDKLDFTLT